MEAHGDGVEGHAQGTGRGGSLIVRRLRSLAWFAVVVNLVMASLASLPVVHGRGRIIGGTLVTEIKYPWLTTLMDSSKSFDDSFCAGALIAPNWVLTAAHCIGFKSPNRISLNLLDLSEDSPGIRINRKVVKRILHPQYDATWSTNDIALVKLKKPVTDITPINLYRGRDLSREDLYGIAGWGDIVQDEGTGVEKLREATVRFVSIPNCTRGTSEQGGYSPFELFPGMMCAAADGKDTCQGDSGGPLFFREGGARGLKTPEVVGIASWGEGCAQPGFPGVYTQVNDYVDWIESVAGVVGTVDEQARDAANELCKAHEPNKKACKASNVCKLVDAGKGKDGKVCRTKYPKLPK